MESSHNFHKHLYHDTITINNYFCDNYFGDVPIPPCFSWYLLENMVRPKGTTGGHVRPELGKK